MGARPRTSWVVITTFVVVCGTACGRFGFDEGDDGDDAPDLARVTVAIEGVGLGTVTGLDGFDCSDAECTADVDPGTAIALRGLATTGGWFRGWSGPCGGRTDCDFVADADVTVNAVFTPRPNRAFVTSTTTTGNIGGISGADAICNNRAMEANLGGSFVAYISKATMDIRDRIAGSRGWVRVDGAPVADLPGDFETGPLIYPIRLDENGADVGPAEIYTATRGGTFYGQSCLDWMSADPLENGHAASASWTSILAIESFQVDCDESKRLLCLETGQNVPVAASPHPTGRLGFVTRNDWTPGGGVASADAACMAEATSIGRSGTFLAMVATSTESASDRMNLDGEPWMRLDGVRYSDDVATTFTATDLDVPFEIDSAGQRVDVTVFSGAHVPTDVAQLGENCSDWTSTDPMLDGRYRYTATTHLATDKAYACPGAARLFCVEQ
jgi:hypothetical protein